MILPPLPKWNTATDDIDSNDFLRRSQDFERSLLPRNIVFPRTGQTWEAVRDCEVNFIARIAGPNRPAIYGLAGKQEAIILPCGRAQLQQGERVRILTLDDPRPIQISFQPVRYHELHESIVPHEIRGRPGYSHYVLSLKTAYTVCCLHEETGYFHELFRLVEDVA